MKKAAVKRLRKLSQFESLGLGLSKEEKREVFAD